MFGPTHPLKNESVQNASIGPKAGLLLQKIFTNWPTLHPTFLYSRVRSMNSIQNLIRSNQPLANRFNSAARYIAHKENRAPTWKQLWPLNMITKMTKVHVFSVVNGLFHFNKFKGNN